MCHEHYLNILKQYGMKLFLITVEYSNMLSDALEEYGSHISRVLTFQCLHDL